MHCDFMVAGLFTAGLMAWGPALAQQTGNIVPKQAFRGAVARALNPSTPNLRIPRFSSRAGAFAAGRPRNCAIPLLAATIRTADHSMANPRLAPQVDASVLADLPAPPCPAPAFVAGRR